MLMRTLILKSAALSPIQNTIRKSRAFRPLVHRFVAGETLDEALQASEALLARGFFVSLDFLGENTRTESEALAAKSAYLRILEGIGASKAASPANPDRYREGEVESLNISIKLTQCGLDLGDDFALSAYQEVLAAAGRLGTFVRVDMEASEYTERTVKIVGEAHREYANTGTVLQAYLKRTPGDVDWAIENGIRTRIVKGAYLEPSEVAFQAKAKVDEMYVDLAKKLLNEGVYPAIATQDARIIDVLNRHVEEKGIDKSRFEYQMLYGIRRDLQEKLLSEGYRVRVYIPYGDAWYPYFTRRIAERPANGFFVLKSLFKG